MSTDEVFTRDDIFAPASGVEQALDDNWLVRIEHIIDGVNLLLSQAAKLRSGGGPGLSPAGSSPGTSGISSPPAHDRSEDAAGMYSQLLGLLHQFEGKNLTVEDLKQELIKRRSDVIQLLGAYLQSL